MRKRVAVVGATGIAGQQFLVALSGHPWFEVALLAASERSAGKTYAAAGVYIVKVVVSEFESMLCSLCSVVTRMYRSSCGVFVLLLAMWQAAESRIRERMIEEFFITWVTSRSWWPIIRV